MKKICSLVLCFAVLFGIAGCGGGKKNSAPDEPPKKEDIVINKYEESYGINDERNMFSSFELPKTVTRLKMPNIFGNNMMFQQNKPMRLWGLAPADSRVEVRLYDESGENVAAVGVIPAPDYSFVCELPARKASFSKYTLKITCGNTERKYSDVLIGEVFLASGQSNMQVVVGETYEGEQLLAAANNDKIRVYNPAILPNTGDTYSYLLQFETPTGSAEWTKGDDGTRTGLFGVSAVAYSCALQMYEELNKNGAQVPVGFLNLPVGGTSILPWLPRYAADDDQTLKSALGSKYKPFDAEKTLNYGEFTALFNTKIAPVMNFNINGMIWYQGETDEGSPDMYRLAIEKLIEVYGREFRFESGKMPMVMCHIAPFNTGAMETITVKTVSFNKIFDETAAKSPETRAVVAVYDGDLRYMMGDCATIHPRVKAPIGRRCGKALYGLTCAETAPNGYKSPEFKEQTPQNGALFVKFAYAGTGLEADGRVDGFAVAGADKRFYAANAEIVSTDTVKLTCEYVPEPLYSSYAYSNLNMKANLSNKEGFAALPYVEADGGNAQYYYCQHDWASCDYLTAWRYLPPENNEYKADNYPLYKAEGLAFALDSDNAVAGVCIKAETSAASSALSVVLSYPYDVHQFNNYTSLSIYVKSDSVTLENVTVKSANNTYALALIGTSQAADGYTRMNFALAGDYPAQLTELRLTFAGVGTIYIDEMSLGNLKSGD